MRYKTYTQPKPKTHLSRDRELVSKQESIAEAERQEMEYILKKQITTTKNRPTRTKTTLRISKSNTAQAHTKVGCKHQTKNRYCAQTQQYKTQMRKQYKTRKN